MDFPSPFHYSKDVDIIVDVTTVFPQNCNISTFRVTDAEILVSNNEFSDKINSIYHIFPLKTRNLTIVNSKVTFSTTFSFRLPDLGFEKLYMGPYFQISYYRQDLSEWEDIVWPSFDVTIGGSVDPNESSGLPRMISLFIVSAAFISISALVFNFGFKKRKNQ
ncbi:MAG: hypothetical protein ACTSRU_08815 [Candidatus Hodarchaeales archaeon]